MKKNILITGMPKSGKSTILRKIISSYNEKVGFVTNEVRKNGERVGFEIETNSGAKTMLASVDFKTSFKVLRYFVDVNNLDITIPQVSKFSKNDLLFLDEIGQMELFSEKFKQLVTKYLDSQNICIVTLSKIYSNSFTEQIKGRDDIILVEISELDRDLKEKYLGNLVKKILKAKRYATEPERFAVNLNEAAINTDHGTRSLRKQENEWICECKFFKENKICSHIIALNEYLKDK